MLCKALPARCKFKFCFSGLSGIFKNLFSSWLVESKMWNPRREEGGLSLFFFLTGQEEEQAPVEGRNSNSLVPKHTRPLCSCASQRTASSRFPSTCSQLAACCSCLGRLSCRGTQRPDLGLKSLLLPEPRKEGRGVTARWLSDTAYF